MGFFGDIERPIQAYLDALRSAPNIDDSEQKVRLLIGALSSILESPEEYEEYAPLTSQWIGDSLRSHLDDRDFSDLSISRTLALTARIIRESTIRRSRYTTLETELLDYYINPNGTLSRDELSQADYIRNGLPISIQKSILNEISDAKRSADDARGKLFDGLTELERRINAHRDELKRVETDYNFVGLTSAFRRLLNLKRREKWASFSALLSLGIASIGVPIAVLLFRTSEIGEKVLMQSWTPAVVASFVAIIGIEVVALYFFRIALRNYQIARSQITSLQLRSAICAFIEGYLEFRARQGKDSTNVLSGFEQLIFAALPDTQDGLPPTIEGLSQVAEIVRASRSG